MHTHATTQASLAADIVNHITTFDEMLKLALTDQDDHAELAERIAALDSSDGQAHPRPVRSETSTRPRRRKGVTR